MSGDQTVLAVAGDNSKTDVAVIQADGALLAAVRGPGASPDRLGLEPALERLGKTVRPGLVDVGAPGRNRRAAVGVYFMAGVDSSDDEAKVAQGVKAPLVAQLPRRQRRLRQSVGGQRARRRCGRLRRRGHQLRGPGQHRDHRPVAALGSLSGDWGDGESLGVAALAAAVRGEDGRAAPTRLTRNLCPVPRSGHRPGGRLRRPPRRDPRPPPPRPGATGDVGAAAIQDRVAEALLDRQADEVVRFVAAAARRLNLGKGPFDAVLSGSMVASDRAPTVVRVRARMQTALPQARVVVCTVPPVVGAALAGLTMVSAGARAAERVRAELVESRIGLGGAAGYLNLPGR